MKSLDNDDDDNYREECINVCACGYALQQNAIHNRWMIQISNLIFLHKKFFDFSFLFFFLGNILSMKL